MVLHDFEGNFVFTLKKDINRVNFLLFNDSEL